jgi:peptidoglycan glycosyltransferase
MKIACAAGRDLLSEQTGPSGNAGEQGMTVNKSISRLTSVFLALFMLLSVGAVYWQVFQSQALATSTYNPSLCDIGNQPVRGSIYDRNGILLAYSQADPKAPCNYRRYYCFPSLSPIIGYFSYIYGETGLEQAYDDILTGKQAAGQDAINNFWDQTLHRPVNGSDIYLTIDARIQNMIDKQFDITVDQPGGNLGNATFPLAKGTVGPPPDEPVPARCQQQNGALMQQTYNQPAENADHNHPGSVIVTDPHTGEILGMLSRPYFNANEIGDYTPCRLYTNDTTNANLPACPGAQTNPPAAPTGTATPTPALTSTIGAEYFKQLTTDPHLPLLLRPTSLYIPGSTFKTMTLSAALDTGKVTLTNPTFGGNNCTAPDSSARHYVVNGHSFDDVDLPTYPKGSIACPIDVEHGYIYSDNIIYAQIGVSLGAATWLNYFQRFGMIDTNATNKQPFPFDFPVKASRVDFKGIQSDNVNLAAAAFGQGTLQISPLEMSFITDTVANDGVGLLPHLLLKVVPHGVNPASVPPVSPVPYTGNGVSNGQIISAQTAQEVRTSMRGVVQQGSATIIRGSRANVGGKTGTAQLDGPDPHSWFISLAPDNAGQTPQYTVVVMRENGDEGLWQAPVADCIFLSLLNLPNVDGNYTCAS